MRPKAVEKLSGEHFIPGRTNRNIPNIMRDPPCARQAAPDPIQSLLPLNPSLAALKGCVIWPTREKARPALRKAGRPRPHSEPFASESQPGFIKGVCNFASRRKSATHLAQGRSHSATSSQEKKSE